MPVNAAARAAGWPRPLLADQTGSTDAPVLPITPSGTWPHALSHEPLLRVSDVLAAIQPEFPTLSPSKLRFLDAQGLVVPRRTAGGYRHYSPADVERVRFVLRQQRDQYRPLTVIAEELAALDRGDATMAVAPMAVGERVHAWLEASDLAFAAGVTVAVVEALAADGLLSANPAGLFSRDDAALVRAAASYMASGGDARAVRSLALAASHESDRGVAAVAPLVAKGDREGARQAALARSEAAIQVFTEALRRLQK